MRLGSSFLVRGKAYSVLDHSKTSATFWTTNWCLLVDLNSPKIRPLKSTTSDTPGGEPESDIFRHTWAAACCANCEENNRGPPLQHPEVAFQGPSSRISDPDPAWQLHTSVRICKICKHRSMEIMFFSSSKNRCAAQMSVFAGQNSPRSATQKENHFLTLLVNERQTVSVVWKMSAGFARTPIRDTSSIQSWKNVCFSKTKHLTKLVTTSIVDYKHIIKKGKKKSFKRYHEWKIVALSSAPLQLAASPETRRGRGSKQGRTRPSQRSMGRLWVKLRRKPSNLMKWSWARYCLGKSFLIKKKKTGDFG